MLSTMIVVWKVYLIVVVVLMAAVEYLEREWNHRKVVAFSHILFSSSPLYTPLDFFFSHVQAFRPNRPPFICMCPLPSSTAKV